MNQDPVPQVVLADLVSWLHKHQINIVKHGDQYKVFAPQVLLERLGVDRTMVSLGFVWVPTIGGAFRRACEFAAKLEP